MNVNVYEMSPDSYCESGSRVLHGCPVEDGKLWLGQHGRGRQQIGIPVPAGSSMEGDRVIGIPGNASTVYVVLRDHSGFRGSWELLGALDEAGWDARLAITAAHRPPDGTGPVAIDQGHVIEDDWSSRSCPICAAARADLSPRPTLPPEWIRGEGRCAQGDAGRMGGGPEYLLALPVGVSIELLRRGRLYGAPAWCRIRTTPEGVVLSNPKADALSRLVAASAWR